MSYIYFGQIQYAYNLTYFELLHSVTVFLSAVAFTYLRSLHAQRSLAITSPLTLSS
jgi:hypothetical protein